MAILPPSIDPPSVEYVEPPLKAWLSELFAAPDPPTAVFFTADFMAVSIMAALLDLGIRVPEDVSLASFDDLPMASTANRSLTSVHTYKRAMARVAVERLLARIEGDAMPAMNITLTTKLMVRASTRAITLP